MTGSERRPGPTDYLFDWVRWLGPDEQTAFSGEFAAVRAGGSAEELTQLMVAWHNRAMKRQARRRQMEREDEGGVGL